MIHERRYYFILYRKTNDISSYTIDDRQRLRRLGPPFDQSLAPTEQTAD